MERQSEHSINASLGKRVALVITTRLLKESTTKPTSKLQELQVCNGNLGIREDTVKVGGNVHRVRRLFFKNSNLHSVGWVINEDIEQCMECAKAFHLLRRRHHCRKCGNIICNVCSRSATIENCEELGLTRICTRCYYSKDSLSTLAPASQHIEQSLSSVEPIPTAQWKTFSEDSEYLTKDIIAPEQDVAVGAASSVEEKEEVEEEKRMHQEQSTTQELENRLEAFDYRSADSQHSHDELLRQAREANEALEERVASLQAELETSKKTFAVSKRKLSQANKRLENNFNAVTSHVQFLDHQRAILKERVDCLEKEKREWFLERCHLQSALKAIEDGQRTRAIEPSSPLPLRSLHSTQVEETHFVERIFVRERVASMQCLVTKLINRSQSRRGGDKENQPHEDNEEVTLLKQLQDSLVLSCTSPMPSMGPSKVTTLPSRTSPATPVQERDWDFGIDSKDYCSPLPSLVAASGATRGREECE